MYDRLTIEKLKIGSQVSDRCPLGYLFIFYENLSCDYEFFLYDTPGHV